MRELWSDKKKLALFLGLIAVGILLAIFVFPHISQEKVEARLRSLGAWAAPLYILLFATLPGFFLPVVVLVLPAGAIFGLWLGTLYTLIGATINMAWMFLVARYLFHERIADWMSRKFSSKWQKLIRDNSEGVKAFNCLLVLRVTPLIPYNFLNYAYGLSSVRFNTYMLASIIGVTPGIMVYVNLGDKAMEPGSAEFWLALSLLLVLTLASSLLSRLFKLNKENKSSQAEDPEL